MPINSLTLLAALSAGFGWWYLIHRFNARVLQDDAPLLGIVAAVLLTIVGLIATGFGLATFIEALL